MQPAICTALDRAAEDMFNSKEARHHDVGRMLVELSTLVLNADTMSEEELVSEVRGTVRWRIAERVQ